MFGYDARGEVTDYYQSVGYWYHVQQGYAANGAIASLQGFNYSNGTNTPFSDLFTYSLDGEGRVNSIVDTTTATTILSSTSYNAASQPLQVGSETFTYYPASSTTSPPGSMNTWQSSFNGNTQTGTLSWNTNGTLQTLQISDNANPSNTQNCGQPGVSAGYTYDDVGRLASVNCGAIGGQTFAYDPYGNITKTANGIGVSFTNGPYDGGLNNHMNGLSYDGMGNVTQDNLGNSYTYDAEGRPVMAAGVSVILDAFGRIVGEPNNAGNPSWGSLVYSPTGWKFALMNQTSLVKYRDPMPGGLVATHNGDGTGYYQHADWQGSSRMGDEGELQVRYDRAYAPFGEPYAELNNNTENRTFTGPQEDTTPGIDDFLMRQYSSSQGRWLVPDPAGLGAVDITNPQTWNRYAYVGNSPLSNIDLLGLKWPCENRPNTPPCNADLDDMSGAAGVAGNGSGVWANFLWYLSTNGSLGYWSGYNDPSQDNMWVPYWVNQDPWDLFTISTTVTAANNGTGCGAKQAVSFIHTNQAAAATIAQQLNVPTQNILGLSGIESNWGQSNAALQANNFFGLHGGANAPFATGVWYTSGGVAMSSFPSYLASGQSFAAQFGSFVNGVSNPTAFAQALVKAGFNPGTAAGGGNPNFVTSTAATINATAGRMQCP